MLLTWLALSNFSFDQQTFIFALICKLDDKLGGRSLWLLLDALLLGSYHHFVGHLDLSLLGSSQDLHLLFFAHLLEFGASLRNEKSWQSLRFTVNYHRLAHVGVLMVGVGFRVRG